MTINVETGQIERWDVTKQAVLAWIEEIKEKQEYELYKYTHIGRSMNRLWKGNLAELQDKFDTQLTDLYDLQDFLEPKGYYVELSSHS